METEEECRIRRRERIEKMKKEKKRTELLHRLGMTALAASAILLGSGAGIGFATFMHRDNDQEVQEDGESYAEGNTETISFYETGMLKAKKEMLFGLGSEAGEDLLSEPVIAGSVVLPPEESLEEAAVPLGRGMAGGQIFEAYATSDTANFDESIISQYGILIDVDSGAILAQKDAKERMNPASMTKILTVLVAAEHLTEADLDETVSITIDITDYCYVNDCSNTGYALDEIVTVNDLFYGTILPSGADSALALAIYVAGSQEAFVELMNEKLAELGLAETSHFTNCIGLYDEEHYSTAYDMAVILKAAVDNEFCREVLSAHTYTTSQTEQHPEGLLISNWFLRRIEDRDTHGEVLCAKTGYVVQSGSCAASFSRGNDGREYLCVTAGSSGTWKCIADQVELYQRFLPEP